MGCTLLPVCIVAGSFVACVLRWGQSVSRCPEQALGFYACLIEFKRSGVNLHEGFDSACSFGPSSQSLIDYCGLTFEGHCGFDSQVLSLVHDGETTPLWGLDAAVKEGFGH